MGLEEIRRKCGSSMFLSRLKMGADFVLAVQGLYLGRESRLGAVLQLHRTIHTEQIFQHESKNLRSFYAHPKLDTDWTQEGKMVKFRGNRTRVTADSPEHSPPREVCLEFPKVF